MTEQKKAVVPGMPLAALNAITDPNTRAVLSALVSAHQVRNGASGNGDERFITAKEAGLVKGYSGGIGANGSGFNEQVPLTPLIPPAQIGRIINDLQAQVIESPLFKDLGERVDLIDKPGGIFDRLESAEVSIISEVKSRIDGDTAELLAREALGVRVGTSEAAILEEVQARVNADNAIIQSTETQYAEVNGNLSLVQQQVTTASNNVAAIARQFSQVQAQVGEVAAAVVQESQVRANADGQINAKYTVKIDNNGYVAGYGLMSTANNAAPFSEFIVRADRFAIGSASGPGITPQVPFIVLTQPGSVGGQYVPAGVYIENAIIMNGSITRAKIGDLEVDTLKIAGNSVMVGVYDSGGSVVVPAATSGPVYRTLITRTLDLGDNYNSGVIVIAAVEMVSSANLSFGFRIRINGAIAGQQSGSLQSGFVLLAPAIGFGSSSGRYATVVLEAFNTGAGIGANQPFTVTRSSMAMLGGKR